MYCLRRVSYKSWLGLGTLAVGGFVYLVRNGYFISSKCHDSVLPPIKLLYVQCQNADLNDSKKRDVLVEELSNKAKELGLNQENFTFISIIEGSNCAFGILVDGVQQQLLNKYLPDKQTVQKQKLEAEVGQLETQLQQLSNKVQVKITKVQLNDEEIEYQAEVNEKAVQLNKEIQIETNEEFIVVNIKENDQIIGSTKVMKSAQEHTFEVKDESQEIIGTLELSVAQQNEQIEDLKSKIKAKNQEISKLGRSRKPPTRYKLALINQTSNSLCCSFQIKNQWGRQIAINKSMQAMKNPKNFIEVFEKSTNTLSIHVPKEDKNSYSIFQ